MKKFGLVLIVGIVTGTLAYFAIPTVIAATPSTGYHANLPIEPSNSLISILSDPLSASLFWIGLITVEFSSGIFIIKIITNWRLRNEPQQVSDNESEVQSLFNAFLEDL
ncbi:MAG: hypothetical protein ACFFF4_00200 [Candidatus Thorarchaeota archaeon]